MSSFDRTGVSNLIGLWDFEDGATTADTGLDDGLAQNGTFESGAGASGGRAHFNGSDDRFDVEGDNGGPLESEFDLTSGTIEVQFTQDQHLGSSVDTIVNRGEFNDRASEGYFSISVTENGAVEVVHQTKDGTAVTLTTSNDFFDEGDLVNVKYTWDETEGAQLTVTNGTDVEVLTSDTTGLNLDIGDNDDEIFTFGARETSDGKYAQEFDGSIDYVAVYESTLAADPDGVVDGEAFDEVMELGYDDSNDPTDGGGDLITNDADVIFGNGGSDTIDGADGDDTIFGDSADAGPVESGIFVWGDAPDFEDEEDASDFTQDTGVANITFTIIDETGDVESTYEVNDQNTDGLDPAVSETESFESLLEDDDDSATYGWSSDVPLENVQFRVNDVDGDGVVQIRAFDPDGNPIEVQLSDVGSDLAASDTDGVPGNDQVASIDDDYTPDSDGIHSVIVTIPGPVGSWEVIHSMSGDNDSGVNFTDITFDVAQPDLGVPGDDVITGGAGADVMFGQDGDDTFIVDNAADGDGDVVDGGNGPDDSADNDTLDLRGAGQVTIDDDVDPNDEGARAGTVTFENGEVLTFSGIETILTDPQSDGIVDGEESGELMGPGYDDSNAPTDQGGDIIDGADGIDDVIEGNGGDDTIDSGLGDDTVDGGSGDDVFDINEEGNGIDNDVITGGEAGETDGDTIDTGDINDDLTVTFTGNEEGTITDGTDTTTFEEIENIQLGGGDDTVIGSDANTENVDGGAGDDVMSGGDGSDTLSGGEGNDSLEGGLGGDSLSGGDDDDTILGDQGIDTIDGGDGNDSIDGGSGVDSIDGGEGDDTILGGSQSDTIDGGDGEDDIDGGTGSDVILSSDGADTIDGGAGTDTYRDDTDETIIVTVDDNGDGTVERVNDGTTDTVEDFENFVAGESPAEADVITLTTPIPVEDIATEIQGLDDNAVGTFTPADGGPVVSFGGPGEPTLSDVFALPQPAGEYQITDGDEDGQIGDISFENFETINFTITGVNPDGVVDGEETGELMGPGYDDSNAPTDQGGDIIDGPDGIDDTIEGNGGDDTIDSGLGDDTVDGGAGDDVFDINDEGDGIDNDVITGGETEEDDGGDTIDTTDIDDDLDVVFTDPEEGTITDGTDTTTFEEIENLRLGGGDDSVVGSDGNENVDGGGGDDTLEGGDGEDTLSGGDGEDSIDGGDGDDVLDGGEGDDTIDGGDGADTVTDLEGDNVIDTSGTNALPDDKNGDGFGFAPYAGLPPVPEDLAPGDDADSVTTGDGNDSITTGDDADTISSGGGDDTIDSGIDNDSVDGGAGADLITTGEGADTVDGGDGNDTIFGGLGPSFPDVLNIPDDGSNPFGPDPDTENGRDLLDGGSGNDLIFGEDDDDTLIGGIGDDTLDGGIDDDSLQGDIGFDSLIGGQGDDTLDGGRGRDTLEGGIGDDVFIETANDGADTIVDFGLGNSGSINDGDQTNNDFVDLSEFYNDTTLADVNANATNPANQFNDPLSMLRADAEDGRLDGVINGEDLSAFIGGIDLTIENAGSAVTGSDLTFDNTNVACFVRGTQIATRRGSVAIEDLKAGDEVITMDHGFQKIRWIGSTSVPATGALAPVVIRKGAMGNERDLRVSPQHRMLVRGWHVELMFGQKEALVPAKALINDETVFPLEGGTVDYFHMMFDRHELVYAEGVPSESFHPGHVGLGSFAEDTREEILTLFPELRADAGSYSEHVRPSLKVREAKVLAENPELLKE